MPTVRARHTIRARAARSTAIVLSVAAIAASITGCNGAGPAPTTDTPSGAPDTFKPITGEMAKVGYGWDWSAFPSLTAGQRVQYLAPFPDAILTQDTTGRLSYVEANTGRVRWATELGNRLGRFVGLAREYDTAGSWTERVVSATESEIFLIDLRTGDIAGRQRLAKVVNTKPLLVGPMAIFGTPAGELTGHQILTGVRAWGFDAPGSIEQPPILVGGLAAALTQEGYIAFVNPINGSLASRVKIFEGSTVEPATDGNLLFIASTDQSLYAVSPSGRTVWRHRTSRPLAEPPIAWNKAVYCTTADDGFAAFEAPNGKKKWGLPDVTGKVVAVRKGLLLVWNGKTLASVDPKRGAVIERAELPGIARLVPDQFEDGNLYALTDAGVVGKFIPR